MSWFLQRMLARALSAGGWRSAAPCGGLWPPNCAGPPRLTPLAPGRHRAAPAQPRSSNGGPRTSGTGSKGSAKSQKTTKAEEVEELTVHRLAQRQKQIDYGKNTLGYQNYLSKVPK